jgi:hypothetical protein
MNTTLGALNVGDRIVSIKNTAAEKVATGIRFTDVPQVLIVSKVAVNYGTASVWFDNGGRLLPVDAKTPCVTV